MTSSTTTTDIRDDNMSTLYRPSLRPLLFHFSRSAAFLPLAPTLSLSLLLLSAYLHRGKKAYWVLALLSSSFLFFNEGVVGPTAQQYATTRSATVYIFYWGSASLYIPGGNSESLFVHYRYLCIYCHSRLSNTYTYGCSARNLLL